MSKRTNDIKRKDAGKETRRQFWARVEKMSKAMPDRAHVKIDYSAAGVMTIHLPARRAALNFKAEAGRFLDETFDIGQGGTLDLRNRAAQQTALTRAWAGLVRRP